MLIDIMATKEKIEFDKDGRVKVPEEEKKEEEKKEEKKLSPIEEAKEVNKEKARLLEEEKKVLERREKLAAEELVGGKASAGTEPVKETDDEKWAREAKERYAGTGMDPTE